MQQQPQSQPAQPPQAQQQAQAHPSLHHQQGVPPLHAQQPGQVPLGAYGMPPQQQQQQQAWGASNGVTPLVPLERSFDYLVILNFQTLEGVGPDAIEEVVSFPFIVLELGPGTVSVYDQQQMYVKPEFTSLDPTAGSNQILTFAPTLAACVRKFDHYVWENFIMKNKSFCLVTESPWDLKYTLRRECEIKGIRLAAYFDRYFDLLKEFSTFYTEVRASNLMEMAQCLRVNMKGYMNGMENCKVISNIIASISREGHVFRDPEWIPYDFDAWQLPVEGSDADAAASVNGGGGSSANGSTRAPTAADVVAGNVGGARGRNRQQQQHGGRQHQQQQQHQQYQQRQQHQGKKGGNKQGERIKAVQKPVNRVIAKDGLAVRLRGLPWDATDADVVEFFGGLRIVDEGILFTFNHRNRPTGEAYVVFATTGDCEQAFERDRAPMGSRYIEVFPSSVEQVGVVREKQQRREKRRGAGRPPFAPPAGDDYTYVMMYGLPYSASVDDVLAFFDGYGCAADTLVMGQDGLGRPTGQAYLGFANEADAHRAVDERNKQYIGERYVNLQVRQPAHASGDHVSPTDDGAAVDDTDGADATDNASAE